MMEHRLASETGVSQELAQRSGPPTGSYSTLQTIGLTLYAIGSFSLFVAFVGFIIGLEGRPYGYLGNSVTLVILSLPILFAGILFFRGRGIRGLRDKATR